MVGNPWGEVSDTIILDRIVVSRFIQSSFLDPLLCFSLEGYVSLIFCCYTSWDLPHHLLFCVFLLTHEGYPRWLNAAYRSNMLWMVNWCWLINIHYLTYFLIMRAPFRNFRVNNTLLLTISTVLLFSMLELNTWQEPISGKKGLFTLWFKGYSSSR